MKHTVTVGKPTKKGEKVTGFTDVTEIPSNEAFKYMRRGFVTLEESEAAKLKRKAAAPDKPEQPKAKAPADKKPAPKKAAGNKKAAKKSAGKKETKQK